MPIEHLLCASSVPGAGATVMNNMNQPPCSPGADILGKETGEKQVNTDLYHMSDGHECCKEKQHKERKHEREELFYIRFRGKASLGRPFIFLFVCFCLAKKVR